METTLKKSKAYTPRHDLSGTAIYADQLGWLTGGSIDRHKKAVPWSFWGSRMPTNEDLNIPEVLR